jgi:hypothetical protein
LPAWAIKLAMVFLGALVPLLVAFRVEADAFPDPSGAPTLTGPSSTDYSLDVTSVEIHYQYQRDATKGTISIVATAPVPKTVNVKVKTSSGQIYAQSIIASFVVTYGGKTGTYTTAPINVNGTQFPIDLTGFADHVVGRVHALQPANFDAATNIVQPTDPISVSVTPVQLASTQPGAAITKGNSTAAGNLTFTLKPDFGDATDSSGSGDSKSAAKPAK